MPPPRHTTPSLFANTPPADPAPEPVSKPASNPGSSSGNSWISAHCDGGARGNPGPSGFGALIQDENGTVLAELSEFLGIRTNNYAEYSGLLGCLNYALEHGHKRLRLVSDSELMVKQIQGKYQVKSPDLKPLYEEAKRRIAKLDAFEISHALRHKNKDADRLANEAMDRGMKRPSSAPPVKATPYPTKAEAPPIPIAYASRPIPIPEPEKPKTEGMLRGFTKDGVIHILGNASLPDGVFVKIIRE